MKVHGGEIRLRTITQKPGLLQHLFHALGMNVVVRPIIGNEAWEEFDEKYYDGDESDSDDGMETQEDMREVTRVGKEFAQLTVADQKSEEGDDPTKVSVACSIWTE